MPFQRGLVSQSFWISSVVFGVPTLDIALLLGSIRISSLAKAFSFFTTLLTRRWHSLTPQVHPFPCQFSLGLGCFLQSLQSFAGTEPFQLLLAGNINPQVNARLRNARTVRSRRSMRAP